MKFRKSDHDWKSYHRWYFFLRRRRYLKVLEGIRLGVEEILNKNYKDLVVTVEVPCGDFSVGVKGDGRVYQPIVMLIYDKFPGYDHVDEISTMITNQLPVNRVTYTMAVR